MAATLAVPVAERTSWPVQGQDEAVRTLKAAIGRDATRHAYVVSGPEGIGKAWLAQVFAQALQCDDPLEPGIPCLACRSCRKIARGVHPDVQVFDLARQAAMAERAGGKNTTMTIETVRELTATSGLRPMESRWRVVIIEDAETLQETAQEALLKTLEDPPGFMVLVLLTNDAEVLLPTVQSRCQQIDLRLVGRPAMVESLVDAGVSGEASADLASLAAGRIGWAHRAASDPKITKRRHEAVGQAMSWIGADSYHRLVTAVRMGDAFTKKRDETFQALEAVVGLWRDALLTKLDLAAYLTYPTLAGQLSAAVGTSDIGALHRAIASVQACIRDLETNVRPRLALEAMVLEWPTR